MNLQKFIAQAQLQPTVAQAILNSLTFDVQDTDYHSALEMLQDDVEDDPDFHGITTTELRDFLNKVS